jgi:hypothetical protein
MQGQRGGAARLRDAIGRTGDGWGLGLPTGGASAFQYAEATDQKSQRAELPRMSVASQASTRRGTSS